MYRRTGAFISERVRDLALQMKERLGFGNLPAMATHLGCFLLGTLIFEPDSRGKVPHDTLVPLSLSRVSEGVHLGEDYVALSEAKACRLSADSFRLWWPEEKRVFAILNKGKGRAELMNALARSDTKVVRKTQGLKPLCLKTSSNVTIYP